MKKALALSVLMASCSAPSVTIVPVGIENSLSGSIELTPDGGAAGSADLDTIGLGGSEVAFSPRLNLNFMSSELSVSTSSTTFAGTGELPEDFTYEDETIFAGEAVNTKMDVTATSVLWTYNFVNRDTARFGVGLGVSAFDFRLGVSSDLASLPPIDESMPVPLIGLRAGGDFGLFRLDGQLGALQVDADDGEISVTDMDVYAGFDIIGDAGSFVVGYRSFDVDGSYDDGEDSVALQLELGGPYLGVRLGF